MSIRRKSLAAVFSFTDKKELENRSNSMDGNASPPKKDLPCFGSVSLKRVLSNAEKPHLISVSPSTTISQALDIMKSNKILSLPLKSRSNAGRFIGIVSAQDLLHYILKKCNQSLNEEIARAVFEDSIENLLSLDDQDESYRIWYESLKIILKGKRL